VRLIAVASFAWIASNMEITRDTRSFSRRLMVDAVIAETARHGNLRVFVSFIVEKKFKYRFKKR